MKNRATTDKRRGLVHRRSRKYGLSILPKSRSWGELGRSIAKGLIYAVPILLAFTIMSYIMVGMTSGIIATSCVEITEKSRAAAFIDMYNTSGALDSFMGGIYRDSLRADSMRVVLYSQDKSATIQIAAVVNPDSNQNIGDQRYSIVSSDNDRQRLSRHQARECGQTSKKESTLLSCPLVDTRGYLVGFSLATYERPLNKEEKTNYLGVLKLETPGIQEIIN